MWPNVTCMDVDQAIGESVHTLMWRQGITQTAMADALGLDQSALSRKLRGGRPWRASEVFAAAALLGVAPGSLYPLTEGQVAQRDIPVAVGDVRQKGCFDETRRPSRSVEKCRTLSDGVSWNGIYSAKTLHAA